MFRIINFVIDVHAIVDLWSEGTRAVASLDYSVASLGPITHSITATGARTVVVTLARHAFAFVFVTIC